MYRGIFAFICVVKCPESATKVRQIPQNSIKCDSVRPCYGLGKVLSISGSTAIPPLMGERYLIPTLYTRVSVRLTTPTQKSVSIDTSGDGVNLTDCTDLCNRLKIALVLDSLKIERNPITTLCPVCLIALSQNCDARRIPGRGCAHL